MSKDTSDFGDMDSSPAKREASEWVVRQSYGLTAEEQDGFFDWLAADPEHAELYARSQKTWAHLDVLAEWRPEHSVKPNPNLLDTAKPKRHSRFLRGATIWGALAAVFAVAFILWRGHESTPSTFLAEGEYAAAYERHELNDGSVVELRFGAQAKVKYSRDRRQIILERGEAHFSVTKDENRPFFVVANGIAVRAIGTAFNVQIGKDSVDVIVTEGRVTVGSEIDKTLVEDIGEMGASTCELVAGQRTVVNPSDMETLSEVESISVEEIDERLIWLNEVLDFKDAPLSEIVMAFNRRNKRKLVIEDGSIETLRLSAKIQPKNIDQFVSVLEVTMGVEAERIGDSVIVLRSGK